jgi:hypothetical protein
MSVADDNDSGVAAYNMYSSGNFVECLRKTYKSPIKIDGTQAHPGHKCGTLPFPQTSIKSKYFII